MTYVFGKYQFNVETSTLVNRVDGEPHPLTVVRAALLKTLLENCEKPPSHVQLGKAIWSETLEPEVARERINNLTYYLRKYFDEATRRQLVVRKNEVCFLKCEAIKHYEPDAIEKRAAAETINGPAQDYVKERVLDVPPESVVSIDDVRGVVENWLHTTLADSLSLVLERVQLMILSKIEEQNTSLPPLQMEGLSRAELNQLVKEQVAQSWKRTVRQ